MMRNSGSPEKATVWPNSGRAPAHDPGHGRRHFGAPDSHQQLQPLGGAAVPVGLGYAQRILRGREVCAGRLCSGLALFDRRSRHDAGPELARAFVIVLGAGHLRLGLRDRVARLRDRGIGAQGRIVVLDEHRIELSAVDPRQHLTGLHHVAVLRVDFDDAQRVDARRDLNLLAGDEGSRHEQAIDEFTRLGGSNRNRRRRHDAGRLGLVGGRRGTSHGRLQAEAGERGHRRRAGRESLAIPEAGDREGA